MSQTPDYRSTVFLPKTEFPMKAGLPQKEPAILARWADADQYRVVRNARAGRPKFILHDGPPYANGDMHIGHALNHILKDMVVRTQTLLGLDAPYVPGWDCHGLPIEWKVEEEYRKKKLNKDEIPPHEFRAECRAYARKWVDVQREQLKRLGINADWDHPYLTMDFAAEATIVRELMRFAETGQLYRGAKPVMWSPVEKTALAEAEIEYEDIISTQIDVAFEIIESAVPALTGAYAVIWTTTPWTIPANQAIAYGAEVDYQVIAIGGKRYLVAEPLIDTFVARVGGGSHDMLGSIKGAALEGSNARHPMHALGGFYARPRPFLAGDFVTTESGTGLVHMAPDHGEDDFILCKAYGIEQVFAVEGDGRYRADWGWLPGEGSVINPKFNAPDGPVCTALREVGALVAANADYRHSYPHSWRSKAKVIFRCTPQWFVPMDKAITLAGDAVPHTLRERAVTAIAQTRWVPEKGRNRIAAMVEGRPDWVLSRQRAWGVPLALFVHRQTGEVLVDAAVNARIVAAIGESGVDAWNEASAAQFLGPDYAVDDYECVTDILDVWFDSGSTHAFVLASGRWPDLTRPAGYTGPLADLYLEGSDQHRGWFQSSLLESCATRGHAPYKTVLTHGFTMDAKGLKMSKSLGNTVSPIDLMRDYGADILRLWALSVDFTEDHRIGKEILAGVADQYRKLRNTFRYLLGALEGFSDAEALPVAEMPELERYVLARLAALDATLRTAVDDYDFNTYVRALTDFCNEDLSAFFFDIRKDSLYCDAPGDVRRRACRTVLDTLFHALVRYATPVLVFTAEEVWGTRYPDDGSVHLLEWPKIDGAWSDSALLDKWSQLRELRVLVSSAIEPLRRDKVIGSSLAANVDIEVKDALLFDRANSVDMAEICIAARVNVTGYTDDAKPDEFAREMVSKTDHHKCGRCWRHLPEVAQDGALCARCDSVVAAMDSVSA